MDNKIPIMYQLRKVSCCYNCRYLKNEDYAYGCSCNLFRRTKVAFDLVCNSYEKEEEK
jgi:hypothetical protein